jgi:hypothetical protein
VPGARLITAAALVESAKLRAAELVVEPPWSLGLRVRCRHVVDEQDPLVAVARKKLWKPPHGVGRARVGASPARVPRKGGDGAEVGVVPEEDGVVARRLREVADEEISARVDRFERRLDGHRLPALQRVDSHEIPAREDRPHRGAGMTAGRDRVLVSGSARGEGGERGKGVERVGAESVDEGEHDPARPGIDGFPLGHEDPGLPDGDGRFRGAEAQALPAL